ncbi:thiamine diphosphokinase [Leuconostoc gasicomitatum]|uniref:thiamine diphosphokinase n=1 Tax=Leuconostoc gasicomitatum TaxID=115778 RepID=UPI001CC35190|nr:thiamine diphosphokinase [Leuconostoc gasicomitatum]MBZ5959812.1 thiamine diphosphokinase [Leuconostoc gasicomitatum]MBZ5970446.1 thiamine diphosphokinase [Leuconostoc gasicomitatum]MBZ5993187.1 thiamine diphosphokinase [Leuconostoc gasicomitatum]MBZ5997743.1 thiamine diphosphokinase [Leuconostoc gasicomitatum]
MQINILAGGATSLWPSDLFDFPGLWIGADRGAWRLYQHHIPMLMAVGDFDSLTPDELHILESHLKTNEIIHVKAEKDETDTELALLYAQAQNPDSINIFGATGGRLDHLLSNLWLLADPTFEKIVEKTKIIDNVNSVSYLKPGLKTVSKIPSAKYLGFMPLNTVANFKIIDAKYPLDLTDSVYKMWSSNEFVGNMVHVSFDTGVIMVTQTRDKV